MKAKSWSIYFSSFEHTRKYAKAFYRCHFTEFWFHCVFLFFIWHFLKVLKISHLILTLLFVLLKSFKFNTLKILSVQWLCPTYPIAQQNSSIGWLSFGNRITLTLILRFYFCSIKIYFSKNKNYQWIFYFWLYKFNDVFKFQHDIRHS